MFLQEVWAPLGARKQLQASRSSTYQTVRGLLRGFGLEVGGVSRGKLPARTRELADEMRAAGLPLRIRSGVSKREHAPMMSSTDPRARAWRHSM